MDVLSQELDHFAELLDYNRDSFGIFRDESGDPISDNDLWALIQTEEKG